MPHPAFRLATGGTIVLLLGSLIVSGYLLVSDPGSGGVFALLFTVLFAAVAVIGFDGNMRLRKAKSAPLRTGTDAAGKSVLEIPYSSVQYTCYAVIMLSIAAVFAIPFAGTVPELPGSAGAAVLWGVLTLFFLSLPVLMLLGRFALGRIQVSEDGVYQRGWTYESFLPWTDITGVAAVSTVGPGILVGGRDDRAWKRRQIARFWKQDRLPKSPMITIPGRDIAADPALVYRVLLFYYEYPAARSELGTEAAVRRARTLSFG